MTSTNQESFYLHSLQNRRKYPISNYPITHSIDHFNINHHLLKQRIYLKHFLYTFIFLLLWTLIDVFYFQLHVQVYNTIYGPFHFNQKQFVEYIKQYKNDRSFLSQFGRIEYIQVELNEDNIQSSINKYDTIRRYSNPRTRENHIATYKRITHPAIYVKLPTSSQNYFHIHHPIHLESYSIETLQCIVRNLPLNSAYTYQTWTEKSEYIQYINEQYAKNSTEFNKAVLTKCGVLIGYLYRPLHEKAFTGRGEHIFTSNDIALNMTHRNDSDQLFVIMLKTNGNEGLDFADESSPFIVCAVANIRKITYVDGICYGKDSSWIRWSATAAGADEYANWLHLQLIEISDIYKQRYEQRLRYEPDNNLLQYRGNEFSTFDNITHRNTCKQRSRANTTTMHNNNLSALIHEEKNYQRFKIERQSTIEILTYLFTTPPKPATAEFIAQFRLKHERNKQVVNMDMVNKQIKCTPCREDLQLNELYANWPCRGTHLFHYECMLGLLRQGNKCPNCRHEVEGIRAKVLQTALQQSLSRRRLL
ncbi:unnamed protein product [Adineta steineri]|uniref:RING-type domain-containing protein n=1 Tax=Adineta steineri TaxID=433720 RepID=A0A814SGY4_9BILA|nr:unnamed protein product [Adineta steineri]CAF4094613.1 unnamed protein product [Adineta steineri]